MVFTFTSFVRVLTGQDDVDSVPVDRERVQRSFSFLSRISEHAVVYGVNTGFGPMAQYKIEKDDTIALQYNLIRSHAAGHGTPLTPAQTRAALITRLRTLSLGYSGVHPDTIRVLQEFLRHDIMPIIPRHGGVGASGDLTQLAHMALSFIGEGEVLFEGKRQRTADVLTVAGIRPLKVYLREGLALINGTSVMTGIGLLNVVYGERLIHWVERASALLLEIVESVDDYFSVDLNEAKQHAGQQVVARRIRSLLKGGKRIRHERSFDIQHGDRRFTRKVQEYYSLRCIPQIVGPIVDAVEQAKGVLERELNSVSDNPVVDADSERILHGGNFHGDYVSFEMDKMRMAITKLTMVAERQLNFLFNDKLNEILPPFINLGTLGLNLGLQGMQFTATSTTAENQTLSSSMYVHSIPNNNDNQDVVSMGTNSALLTEQVIQNSFKVIAIELIALAQAVDYLQCVDELSEAGRQLVTIVRKHVPVIKHDEPLYGYLADLVDFISEYEVSHE